MIRRPVRPFCFVLLLVTLAGVRLQPAAAAFDIEYTVANPSLFSTSQLQILSDALADSQALWESVVTGYQPGITLTGIAINVNGTSSGLATAYRNGKVEQGGFTLTPGGTIEINVDQIEPFADWQGPGANGLNFVDDIMAHETGHILGIGQLWQLNGLYEPGSYQYTGQHGLAAYRQEFDPSATYVPVENAGSPGTVGSHWDQRMRSSVQEGNPSDPWSLSPLTGVTDPLGRDWGLELMTGAIDPDWGEPFLSQTTVQSLRDMGYTVVPEPGGTTLICAAIVTGATLLHRRKRRQPVRPR